MTDKDVTVEHGQLKTDDTIAAHRWVRFRDEETGAVNHWCADGDTSHHDEPCTDAEARIGDHADDQVPIGEVPLLGMP